MKSPTCCPKGLPFLIQTRSLVFISADQYISGTGEKLVFGSTRLHGKEPAKVLFQFSFAIFFVMIYRGLKTVIDNCATKKCSEIIYTENSATFCEVQDFFLVQKVFCRKQILTLCSALVLSVSVMGLMVCWDGP